MTTPIVSELWVLLIVKTCVPEAGPAVPDDKRRRRDPNGDIQRSFYSGHKKHHGLKFQTVEAPNGICLDIAGPYSYRHHDLHIMENSQINDRLAAYQEGEEMQYVLFGDKIFPIISHIIREHQTFYPSDQLFW